MSRSFVLLRTSLGCGEPYKRAKIGAAEEGRWRAVIDPLLPVTFVDCQAAIASLLPSGNLHHRGDIEPVDIGIHDLYFVCYVRAKHLFLDEYLCIFLGLDLAIEDFESDWEINWSERVISCVSPRSEIQYTVTDFWCWVRKMEASDTGMVYPRIVDTDGMGSAYNIPRKVRLANSWKISINSIKYLQGADSALLSESNQILVPDSLREKGWWENGYVQALLLALAVAGMLAAFL